MKHDRSGTRARRLSLLLCLLVTAGFLGITSTYAAKPDASLASGGLDGSKGTMQPMETPARVSRVAVVPGTGGSEAWAIGQMDGADPEWGENQLVFLQWRRGEGWAVHGPPRDASGAVVKGVVLMQMAFAPNGEAWAVGLGGALIHHSPGGGWTYRSACDQGGAMEGACGDLRGVSLASAGGETVGFAVGPTRGGNANTILKLSGGNWAIDNAAVLPDPNPLLDFISVAAVNRDEAWAVGTTSARELQIFRRENGIAWRRQRTNKPLFDNPAPSNDGGTVNLSAIPTSVAASTDGSTIWVGGGIYPVDPGRPLGQADAPFTLRWSEGSFRSFCPPQYSLYNDNVSVSNICDDKMPMSPYDVSSLSILSNNELFAGGAGLFHYKDGVWWREPNSAGYLSSVSFFSASDGWVASSGNNIGGLGPAVSSSNTVGHYVTRPGERPRSAPWPHFNKRTLFGVAVNSSGTAVAAGAGGSVLIYRPGVGWEYQGTIGAAVFRGAAWADSSTAWLVGDRGAIGAVRGGSLDSVPSGINANLNSIALSGSSGFAVGDRGSIVRLSGGRWQTDPSSGSVRENLYDVAAVGGGFVAVGAAGTVLVNPSGSAGGWTKDESVHGTVKGRPDFLSVAGTRAGRLAIAGLRKSLVVREPGADFRQVAQIDSSSGSIIDLAMADGPSGPRIFAVSTEFQERFKVRRTTLLSFENGRWKDLEMFNRRLVHSSTDRPGILDPMFSIALDPSGRSGWGVGGIVPRVPDQPSGSASYYESETSAIYRFDLANAPEPPVADAENVMKKSTFSFAFFSESSCGQSGSNSDPGFCSIGVGSGMMPDQVALRIRDQINAASKQPGGPRFVIFGGSMRTEGRPEELESFKGYLSDFEIPVFAALGPNDLFYSNASGQADDFLPELPDDDLERAGLKPPKLNAAASNRFALRTFADQCAPWGTNPRPDRLPGRCADILPVNVGQGATDGLARTHYAFDYAPGGRRRARFAVLDTSDFLFSKTGSAATSQNPPGQDQSTWLSQVAADARAHNPPLPLIIISNVPTTNPINSLNQPVLVDGKAFETAAISLNASAVINGYVRANAADDLLGQVPVYILGGGGAAPGQSDPKYPNDGFYHSWGLIGVDTLNTRQLYPGALPQAGISVAPIPVIETVALHPLEGLRVEGGWTLQFQAMAKAIPGGTPPNDKDQKRMAYLQFPTAGQCLSDGLSGPGFCLNQSALPPDYHFVSESPDIVEFVRPSGTPRYPAVVNGFLIKDDQAGFLCSFKAGKAWVKIVSGMKQMRMQVTVGAGFGPCVDRPIFDPAEKARPGLIRVPELPPAPAPLSKPPILSFNPPNFPESLVVVLPPVPAPIAAPAPPASAAGSRKEEEEAQFEEQGDEGDSEARVLGYERRQSAYDPVLGWITLSTAAAMGILGLLAAGSIQASRKRVKPQAVYVDWRN